MPEFRFASEQTPEQNIDAFFAHMQSIDAEFAGLLREHIARMMPLPEGAQRHALRQRINGSLLEALSKCPQE